MLDNPVWHALRGPHSHLAESSGRALRYPPDVASFGALPDDADTPAWSDMARLVGPGRATVVFRDDFVRPPAWEVVGEIPTVQMVLDSAPASSSGRVGRVDAVELGPADAPEMMALVQLTQPGPFRPRTGEMGRYIGVRREGELVAMAGERVRLEGATEISAVCTRAEHRGQGLATALVLDLVDHIRSRRDLPFLHVAVTNVNAIRLYEELGFTTRRRLTGVVMRAPAAAVD